MMENREKQWKEKIFDFIFPRFELKFFIRLAVIAGSAVILLLIFKPCRIDGSSMEPTFKDGGVTISCRLSYLFSVPEKGDVVTIAFFGNHELLKRVVAVPGDEVEFRSGRLFVNGTAQYEPYVKYPCRWSMKPVKVREGYCFVVGDNRSQAMDEHLFGEVLQSRISGGVLF